MNEGASVPAVCQGNAGRGRPKGSLNKTTRAAKETIALAAEELGGVDGLVEWVRSSTENKRIFWSVIYVKLLPLKLSGEIEMETGPRLTGALTWRDPQS